MSKRSLPSHAEVLAVMRHLADVAALKGDPPAQRQLLVDGLNQQVGTDAAFFYVADQWELGGRPRFTHYTLSTVNDPAFLRYAAEFGVSFQVDDDPYCYQSIRCPDPLQAWTIRDAIPDTSARRRHADFLELRANARHRDGMITLYRVPEEPARVIGFAFHRFGQQRRLTARQVAFARFAIGEVRQLVERGHLPIPPIDATTSAELPPRLRQVLDRLLAGEAPKAIAFGLGLSVWTVREHIQRLYAHYGVSGREELMARFVR